MQTKNISNAVIFYSLSILIATKNKIVATMIPNINSLVLIKLVLKNPIPNPAKAMLPIFIRILARFSFCFFVNSKINYENSL